MTKWRGSHFRSMGVNGESIVTVKPPWVKYLSLWATQRQLFCKSSVPGDSVATRPEEAGWCTRHCVPFMVKYLPVLVVGLHQPLLGFRFLPGGSRAVLQKCLWRSRLWKAPALRRSVWCGAPSLPTGSAFGRCFPGEGALLGAHRALPYLCFNHMFHGSAKAA